MGLCLAPSIVGRNNHGIVTVLSVNIGPVESEEVIMLVEDGVEIGDLAVHRRASNTLLLVQLLDVIAVEIVADGVKRVLVVVE